MASFSLSNMRLNNDATLGEISGSRRQRRYRRHSGNRTTVERAQTTIVCNRSWFRWRPQTKDSVRTKTLCWQTPSHEDGVVPYKRQVFRPKQNTFKNAFFRRHPGTINRIEAMKEQSNILQLIGCRTEREGRNYVTPGYTVVCWSSSWANALFFATSTLQVGKAGLSQYCTPSCPSPVVFSPCAIFLENYHPMAILTLVPTLLEYCRWQQSGSCAKTSCFKNMVRK